MRRLMLNCARCIGYAAMSYAIVFMGSPTQGGVPGDKSNFAERVITIDGLAGEIVAIEGLLADGPFIKLADGGAQNIDECVRFLAEQGHTPQQRMIAILSMHKLGAREYVIFLRKLAELFDHDLVSRNEIGLAVVPTFAFSVVLIENYTESDVRSVLGEFAARKGIRLATKSAIESILDGTALKDLQSFRRDCCSGSATKP